MFTIKNGAAGIVKKLKDQGFETCLVGGCIRDLLLDKIPDEWDITTSAKPEEVAKLFGKVVPTGIDFGTVTVLLPDGQYEVTTFRADEKYVDGRHPSNVVFTKDIHQDLCRRDFTMNAIAYNPETAQIIDDFSGEEDIKKKIIRAVGDPVKRFSEDGLRPLRACRFAAKLGFKIETETFAAIAKTLETFKKVAAERVHDELVKMLGAEKPSIGFELMRECGLLKIVLPELEVCRGVEQPPEFHPYDVYWHSLYSCDAAPKDDYVLRLAALLHDIAKPACRDGFKFYNHDQVGTAAAEKILKRLKFSSADIARITNLIANHMFEYTAGWGDAAVRRFLRRIGGPQNIPDLFALRRADMQAMGREAHCGYLGELQQRIDKIIKEENALDVSDLKVSGNDVMQTLNIPAGPKVGKILNELLEKVLDDPTLNEKEKLIELIKAHA